MSKKKILMHILTALCILAVSILGGCSKNEKGKESTSSPAQNTASNGSETNAQPTLPDLKPAKLRAMVIGPGFQADTQKVWAEFNKQLSTKYLKNTEVEFDIILPSEFKDRWQTTAASGEEIDIAWTGYVLSYVGEVKKEAYMPLDELLDQYGQDLKNELPSWLFDLQRVDGVLYSIPCYQVTAQMPVSLKIPKSLADQYLDIEEMKRVFASSTHMTKEKFDVIEKFLKTLKDNGKLQKGISPVFFISPSGIGYERIEGPAVIDRTGTDYKVVNEIELPDHQLYMDTLNRWFKEGYIRQDVLSLTKQDRQVDEGKPDGYVMWMHNSYSKYSDEQDTARHGFEIINVPVVDYNFLPNAGSVTNLAIPITAKNPERAMMLIDLLSTQKGKDLYNLLIWGLEGEHYERVSENRIKTLDYSGSQGEPESRYGQWKWVFGNTFNAWLNQAVPDGYNEYIIDEVHKNAKPSQILGFRANTDPIKLELAYYSSIIKEFDMCQYLENYEEKYAEMKKKLKDSGVDNIIAEIQRQVDEWLKVTGKK